jgi:nucleoside-diphosphate-sugar epimerase
VNVLVLGSSGFIGSNLCHKLENEGHRVVGVDFMQPLYYKPKNFFNYDLRYGGANIFAAREFDEIYCLACLMGGMGFLGDEEKHGYEIAIGSTQIITNTIEWTKKYNPNAKIFYSSSACVYNQQLQTKPDSPALKESDAIPAWPDLLYGWQKLYSEFMFMASGLDYRIARFHNIFGKWGCYDTGKEKAPAALCRKVAMAKDGDEIEVWGRGYQTRSFLHIDECMEGIDMLMKSDYKKPINIGSDELVTINGLAQHIIDISGKKLTIKNVEGNVGVQGRNSDNTMIERHLNWKPKTKLHDGLAKTYEWIKNEVYNKYYK